MDKITSRTYALPPRDTPQMERYTQTKRKRVGKRYFMQMEQKEKAGVAILIANKIDFNTKAIGRDKEIHYIMIKGTTNKRI